MYPVLLSMYTITAMADSVLKILHQGWTVLLLVVIISEKVELQKFCAPLNYA